MAIKALYELVCEKKSIQLKLDELNKQKTQLNEKIVMLKSQYEKEQKDVDNLENNSLSKFFYNLTGKLDEKLDKETREMLTAKGIYDNAVFQLSNINTDIAKYEKRISELSGCEEQYEETVKLKLDELKGTDPEIVKLQIELATCDNKLKEIREAVQAGNAAYTKAQEVSKELSKADNWALFDIFGGGLIADMVKYDHMDKANILVNEMYSHMAAFKTELRDIDMSVRVDTSVDGLLMAADYFFDNIFTDAAVQNKIQNAKGQVNNIIFAINDALYNLNEMEKAEKEKSEQLNEKLNSYIVAL
ncbi:MAG: hypothetical protein E7484_05445 [Ruminococcaceae bacterium]|nr:hypothetical protein [Oscillospiraceae bacterium]